MLNIMKIKILVALISLTTVITSGVVLGIKNSESKEEMAKTAKTSIVREAKKEDDEKQTRKQSEKKEETTTILEEVKKEEQKNTEPEKQTVAENKTRKEEKITRSAENKSVNTEKVEATPEVVEEDKVEIKEEAPAKVEEAPAKSEETTANKEEVFDKYYYVGAIVLEEGNHMPIIGGYASSSKYAVADLHKKTLTIVERTEIIEGVWNSLTEEEKRAEGSRIKEDRHTVALSDEERDVIYNTFVDAQDNLDANDIYSFEFYRDYMLEMQAAGVWEYEDDLMDDKYFELSSDKYEESIYVFSDFQLIRYLHNLLEK